MGDPVLARIELGFYTFGFVVFLWMAIDPRRVLEFVFARYKPLPQGTLYILRVLAIMNTAGLAAVLVWRVVRLLTGA